MMTRNETEERAFFTERGFGQSMGFGERPALIVVDFMVAFTNPQLPLGASVDAEIDQTNRLLDAAHEARIPAFFSSVSYDEPDLADAGVWPRKMEGLSTLRADAPHVAQDPRLHRAPADPVINKKYASCFFGTDFASRLHHRKIDTRPSGPSWRPPSPQGVIIAQRGSHLAIFCEKVRSRRTSSRRQTTPAV